MPIRWRAGRRLRIGTRVRKGESGKYEPDRYPRTGNRLGIPEQGDTKSRSGPSGSSCCAASGDGGSTGRMTGVVRVDRRCEYWTLADAVSRRSRCTRQCFAREACLSTHCHAGRAVACSIIAQHRRTLRVHPSMGALPEIEHHVINTCIQASVTVTSASCVQATYSP